MEDNRIPVDEPELDDPLDRVTEALERARQVPLGGGPAPARVVRPGQPLWNRRKAPPVAYTQTRAFVPDPTVLKRNQVVAGASDVGLSTAFKLLRTQLLQKLAEHNWTTLAITSPGTGEGKTFTAVNLAVTIAQEVDRTVLLVEADLRAPSLHEYFGYQRGKGLSDYLLDRAPIGDLLLHPKLGRLVLLPGGSPVPNSAELLRSPLMSALVGELKNRYEDRIVIFDLPPALTAADAGAFAPLVDATFLVVEEGRTHTDHLERAVTLLGACNLIGVVLNKSREFEYPTAKPRGWFARLLSGGKG